jgi:3-oxoacyl-(acyl-carrier-protein) synthase
MATPNDNNSSVYVAGLGVISAIGYTVTECFAALKAEQAGIAPIRHLRTAHREEFPVGGVSEDNVSLARRAGVGSPVSRTALLSLIAAREALTQAALPDGQPLRIGFVSANTVGGMDLTEGFYPAFLNDPQAGHLRDVVNHECGACTDWVAAQLGIHDHTTTINTACSSSANAIGLGARLIRHGMLDAVLAGGADSLTAFTLNGFNSLMILDREPCTPFDENRRGLNLGEGAGYLLLVSSAVAAALPHPPVCRLSGFANRNDAWHQTASSPDGRGSFFAMQGALQTAGLSPADIGYINLHGTGTPNNDLAEGLAISRLFASGFPEMSSTKAYTGHTLGASGGIEAVFSALAVQHDIVFPNLRWQTPMKELPFTPTRQLTTDRSLKHVLSNSFGFGGNCSSLIFSKS